MIGELKGYCLLESLDNVFIGYDKDLNPDTYEDIKKRVSESPMRIMDIGVDNSGFLCLEPLARCLVDVRSMDSVRSHFFCESHGDVLLPPGLDMIHKMTEFAKRMTRKGGYGDIVRKMVIFNSLRVGKFDDEFLFSKEKYERSDRGDI